MIFKVRLHIRIIYYAIYDSYIRDKTNIYEKDINTIYFKISFKLSNNIQRLNNNAIINGFVAKVNTRPVVLLNDCAFTILYLVFVPSVTSDKGALLADIIIIINV